MLLCGNAFLSGFAKFNTWATFLLTCLNAFTCDGDFLQCGIFTFSELMICILFPPYLDFESSL